MDKEQAKEIIESCVIINEHINKIHHIIRGIHNEKESLRLNKSLGQAMGVITGDFIFSISQRFPELDPYKEE